MQFFFPFSFIKQSFVHKKYQEVQEHSEEELLTITKKRKRTILEDESEPEKSKELKNDNSNIEPLLPRSYSPDMRDPETQNNGEIVEVRESYDYLMPKNSQHQTSTFKCKWKNCQHYRPLFTNVSIVYL